MKDIDYNKKTIQAYDNKNDLYESTAPKRLSSKLEVQLLALINGLHKNANILEIGSGPIVRDANFFISNGFTNICLSDASKESVNKLRRAGYNAFVLDIITGDINGKYDLIFSNAVMHHFNESDLVDVLRKIKSAIKYDGKFFFTLKTKGVSYEEEISTQKLGDPRFFAYYDEELIKKILHEIGFTNTKIIKEKKIINSVEADWLYITVD